MGLNKIFERIKAESYWKERVVTGFMVAGYLIGNLVEMMSGKVTDDPAAIWIAGVLIGTAVIVGSLIPRFKQ